MFLGSSKMLVQKANISDIDHRILNIDLNYIVTKALILLYLYENWVFILN